MIKTTGIDLECDSCHGTILAGEKFKSVRLRRQKAFSRKHAMVIKNSLPKHVSRHLNCPEPALQVDCPKCLSYKGHPCVVLSPLREDIRTRKPHNARLSALYKERGI